MTAKTHRILHVLNYSLPYISGYCSRSHYILDAQKASGLEVAAVTSPRHQEIIPESQDEETIEGITYYRTSIGKNVPGRGSQAFRARFLMRELEKRIGSIAALFNPTVIHAHSPSLVGIPAQRAASRLGIPCIYEVRALWEDAAVDQSLMRKGSWKYRLSRYMETKLFRRADAIVVLCHALKDEIGSRIKSADKIHVVPNGVDLKRFRPIPANSELAAQLGVQNNVVVGFIGTFFRFEGLDDLVRSWDTIAEAAPHARLLLVGYGELTEELEKLKANSRHGRMILLTGRVPHEKVLDYYSIMDIVVYPRKSVRLTELVTPLKPLEAMAMGKAVVASDVGGLREIADGGRAGVLFRAGSREDLVAQVLQLIGDEARRKELGNNAREYTIQKRGWSNIIESYEKIYSKTRPA